MTPAIARIVSLGLIFLLCSAAWAQQHRHDPLNQLEIDQLRDTAQDPLLRLKLFAAFARARLAAIEQLRADPKVTDRAQQTHDRLQDFLDVYDELNDNVDTYADRKEDLRKALKAVIEADTEFQSRLRALKDSATASQAEAQQYELLLSSSLETLDSSAQDHRKLLAEQEETFKHKKPAKELPAGGRQ